MSFINTVEYGRTKPMMFPSMSVIYFLSIGLFSFALITILSLIPTYLEEKTVSSTISQNVTRLSVTYKRDLSEQPPFILTNTDSLNQQLVQEFGLKGANLSIDSHQFSSTIVNGRRKRDTVLMQCEDGSTFTGIQINFLFSVRPIKGRYTNYQWQQYTNKIQNNLRTVHKQLNMTMFINNQTILTRLTFCSLEKLSPNTTPSTVTNKTRLYCPIAILGGGIGGSHSAFQLAPIYKSNLCLFERENHVGGRTYDIDGNGNVPDAYSTSSILPIGAARFYDVQPVIKQLADELNVSYYRYDYQTTLIKTRGQFYTSYNEMCAQSYIGLTCTDDSNGFNAQDQIWNKLIMEYQKNASNLYHFVDVSAYCRSVLGDEGTEYFRDSYRFRGDFLNVEPRSYMELSMQQINLTGPIYYPYYGLSQLSKRMIFNATQFNNARLYLNEEVIEINDNSATFSIATTNYQILANQLILAIPPLGWTNIQGTIAKEIKSNKHFQAILPIKTVIIENYWPQRWWEQSTLFGSTVDRAWTKQNCISFIEILSQHPPKRDQNLTKTVYDDGQCVETWSALIQRSSQTDLIEELLRDLRSIFIDVQIPEPTKTFTKIWHGAWHYQRSNSNVTNQDIVNWALQPIPRFDKSQITLVGEAYNLNCSAWTDGAVKSSMMSLNSQFKINTGCYANDAMSNGNYCSENFI